MKLSERMKEIFAGTTQDLTIWVASWVDEVAQLEAELAQREQDCIDRTVEALALEAENEALKKAKEVVKEQAADEGLWFLVATAPEGYLQQELRRLHAVIEGNALLTGEQDD